VVTSLEAAAWVLSSCMKTCIARGDIENRIKEQLCFFADRVSEATLRANQLRLYLSVMAYSLVCGLRRLGRRATQLARGHVGTIRLPLLKIDVQLRVTVRKPSWR
jgi:hypothetical protein